VIEAIEGLGEGLGLSEAQVEDLADDYPPEILIQELG
jgi:hypothetical protein